MWVELGEYVQALDDWQKLDRFQRYPPPRQDQELYSGTVAGAREAVICGVPAISFSLNWKRGESSDADFKVAASLCMPIIKAALQDTTTSREFVSKGCYLNVDIPTSPLKNKGYRTTRQGSSRLAAKWRAVSPSSWFSGAGLCKENAIGVRLAELSSAASAVAAARRLNSPLKNMEIESVAGSENGSGPLPSSKKLYFLNDTAETEIGSMTSQYDFGALNEGYVTITPLGLMMNTEAEVFDWASQWISIAVEFTAASSL
ncbi:hypothetical protein L7F22_048956 [Adiantum nelumboides]|nr:hypothetical protein [Adiantum nelumboides]